MMDTALSILIGALTAMVPLVLTSVGATVSERAGVVNIGYEGILLMSAFFGAMFAEISGSPWIGLIGGAFIGMLLGMLHGWNSSILGNCRTASSPLKLQNNPNNKNCLWKLKPNGFYNNSDSSFNSLGTL